MAYCSKCNEQRPGNQQLCGVCGTQLVASAAAPGGSSDGGYFSFRKFISPTLIKIIYVLGAIFITIGGIVAMASPAAQITTGYAAPVVQSSQGLNIVLGLFAIFFGNLMWRVICESWIVLFNMRDLLASIEKESKRR